MVVSKFETTLSTLFPHKVSDSYLSLKMSHPGADLKNKFEIRVITLLWNSALWLAAASHVMNFNQSECIISEQSYYSKLKFFCEIGSWPLFVFTNITIFTPKICEKCPSSVQCWDSNSRPSEQESPTVTTQPRDQFSFSSNNCLVPKRLSRLWIKRSWDIKMFSRNSRFKKIDDELSSALVPDRLPNFPSLLST